MNLLITKNSIKVLDLILKNYQANVPPFKKITE
jgi:hypothetical protein